MLTLVFIILKIFNFLHISWWWILIPIILDEESSKKLRETRVFEDAYSNLEEEYPENEDDVREILEEYDYDIDEDDLRDELRGRT